MPRVTQDAKIQLLRRTPLFADLSKRELIELARLSDDLEVPAGAVLAREGEIGHEFFAVVEGEVEFARGGRTLDVSGPVEFFGEISLVEHTRRLATVTATTPLRFFVLGSREFRTLMDDNPRIERKVLLALARRLLSLVEAERHPTLA
jgi:CRP/FNR family transcriptional regulator, cyclic AMP receptor protein